MGMIQAILLLLAAAHQAKGHMYTMGFCSCSDGSSKNGFCDKNTIWLGNENVNNFNGGADDQWKQYIKEQRWCGVDGNNMADEPCKCLTEASGSPLTTFSESKLCGYHSSLVVHPPDQGGWSSKAILNFYESEPSGIGSRGSHFDSVTYNFNGREGLTGWDMRYQNCKFSSGDLFGSKSNSQIEAGKVESVVELSREVCEKCSGKTCTMEFSLDFDAPGRSAGERETYTDCVQFQVDASCGCDSFPSSISLDIQSECEQSVCTSDTCGDSVQCDGSGSTQEDGDEEEDDGEDEEEDNGEEEEESDTSQSSSDTNCDEGKYYSEKKGKCKNCRMRRGGKDCCKICDPSLGCTKVHSDEFIAKNGKCVYNKNRR